MADEQKFREMLKAQVGSNKELKNLIFELEQLIFKEMQAKLVVNAFY